MRPRDLTSRHTVKGEQQVCRSQSHGLTAGVSTRLTVCHMLRTPALLRELSPTVGIFHTSAEPPLGGLPEGALMQLDRDVQRSTGCFNSASHPTSIVGGRHTTSFFTVVIFAHCPQEHKVTFCSLLARKHRCHGRARSLSSGSEKDREHLLYDGLLHQIETFDMAKKAQTVTN